VAAGEGKGNVGEIMEAEEICFGSCASLIGKEEKKEGMKQGRVMKV